MAVPELLGPTFPFQNRNRCAARETIASRYNFAFEDRFGFGDSIDRIRLKGLIHARPR
jgi:hypothetical protein